MIDFPIIDSHIHLLDQKRFGYAWADGEPALKRDWTPNDLAMRRSLMRSKAWCSSKSMSTCRNISTRPNGWTASLRSIVASWAPSSACRSSAGGKSSPRWRGSRSSKRSRGVRRLIQNQPDPEFVLRPGFLEAIRLLPKYNLSFDICILHPQMPNTLAMMRHCPEVSFILDHIGKPGIKAGLLDPWRAHLREMAALPNVVCKLSGVTTEADHKSWTRDQLRPYIDHVIECFGPDRILYGGDWPVSELAGSYLQWLTTLDWATAGFSPADKRKLFRDNAVKAYRLGA